MAFLDFVDIYHNVFLFICHFIHLGLLVSLAKGLSSLLIFQRTNSLSHCFFFFFYISVPLIFALILIVSLQLLLLSLAAGW